MGVNYLKGNEMIKNRNIDPAAGIDPGKIAGGFNDFFIPNNVRRVFQTSSTKFTYANRLYDMMPSNMVYVGTTAHKTAIEAADEADVVYIHAGDSVYRAGALITATADRLKIFGQQTNMLQWGSPSVGANAGTYSTLYLNGNQIEVAGIGFHHSTAYAVVKIADHTTTTKDIWRTHIHDCHFNANSAATIGIEGSSISYDMPSTMIERCAFLDFVTYAIYDYLGGYSCIQDCIFHVHTDAVGIHHRHNTTSRAPSFIRRNLFTTIDGTDGVGIQVYATPTAGYFIVENNNFGGNFASEAHCISTKAGYMYGQNWHGSTIIAYS